MDELVSVMTPVLWQVVRAYRHDRETTEDIVSSTWVGFVRRHATIQDPQAVASWLITSARREAARHARTAQRTRPVEEEELMSRLPDTDSAEASVIDLDEADTLWRAVATLDERCRHLLRVIAFQDRPEYALLAEELGMPVGSIGPTRARCLTKLRAVLAAGGAA